MEVAAPISAASQSLSVVTGKAGILQHVLATYSQFGTRTGRRDVVRRREMLPRIKLHQHCIITVRFSLFKVSSFQRVLFKRLVGPFVVSRFE